MIRYALRCDEGHGFDGWFRSAEGFDSLLRAGQVECAVCGSTAVSKAPMAPAVPTRDSAAARADLRATDAAPDRPLAQPGSRAEAALAEMRRHVEANSDYVGGEFATQARAMHDGHMPRRTIHGEARLDDAKKLIEDGVPVMPLPFRARGKLS